MSASIRLIDVHKRYGDLEVLRGINLEIPAGQTVSVIGPSGSGKSTLLRLLMTLDKPTSGTIEIDGESMWTTPDGKPAGAAHVRRLRGKIGMVFQHFNLFPHMTALGNVIEAPMHVAGLSREEAIVRGREYLDMVGLGDKYDAYPSQLSGGQKQRVGIARALVKKPRLVLADEPTANLDSQNALALLTLMQRLTREAGIAFLVATHDSRLLEAADRRFTLCDGRLTP